MYNILEFLKIILDAYVKKGKVLIPVFGIGRSQEMLLTIESLIKQERLPADLKVYIDGMVGEVTAIHTAYPEFLRTVVKPLLNRIERKPYLTECPKHNPEFLKKLLRFHRLIRRPTTRLIRKMR